MIKHFIEINIFLGKLIRIEFDPLLPSFFPLLTPFSLNLIWVIFLRLRCLKSLKHSKVHKARILLNNSYFLFFFHFYFVRLFLLFYRVLFRHIWFVVYRNIKLRLANDTDLLFAFTSFFDLNILLRHVRSKPKLRGIKLLILRFFTSSTLNCYRNILLCFRFRCLQS